MEAIRASQATTSLLAAVVVAAVVVSDSAVELADFSPSRWEHLSLLFPRSQISPNDRCEYVFLI